MNQQHHEMTLERGYPDGDEVWHCSICGKRIMLGIEPPRYDILERGDEYATHSGSKGGLRIGTVQVSQSDQSNQATLDIWLDWLKGIDLDGL